MPEYAELHHTAEQVNDAARGCVFTSAKVDTAWSLPNSLPMVDVTETIARAIVASERSQEPREGGLAEALIAGIGSHQLEGLIRQYLPGVEAGLLDSSRDLLESWLQERGNQCAMAEALGCHRRR